MKIKLRFLSFFTIGLVGFVLYIGLIMFFLFDFLLPILNISKDNDFTAFILLLGFTFISGGALFSVYFINPLLLMLSIINQLSKGTYDISILNNKLYMDNGDLKIRYFLYKELINDLSVLSSKLEKAKQEQEHLEQAKEEWIRGISHDLKTPLSYILGYSALLGKEDYHWKEEELRKFINKIYVKGKYMEQLISGLKLSLTKEYSSTIMPISIKIENQDTISVEFADNGIGLENQCKELLMKTNLELDNGRGLAVVKQN